MFAPVLNENGVFVQFGLDTLSKAVGIGRNGVSLVTPAGIYRCSNLEADVPHHRNLAASSHGDVRDTTITINTNQCASFGAGFPVAVSHNPVNVVIEAKRIFARNIVFIIPFASEFKEVQE